MVGHGSCHTHPVAHGFCLHKKYSTLDTAPAIVYATRMILDVDLHPGQQKAQDSTAKVIAVIAGTGGGKTAYIPVWVAAEREKLYQARPNHKVNGIVVAPYKILRRTTMPTFLNLFQNKLGLGEWESRQDGIWRFNDGG